MIEPKTNNRTKMHSLSLSLSIIYIYLWPSIIDQGLYNFFLLLSDFLMNTYDKPTTPLRGHAKVRLIVFVSMYTLYELQT